jgi:hypothetical protein
MNQYAQPYLQKYKGKDSRHQCPACNDKSSFVLYLDGNTNLPIHKTVGKCNHGSGCGYHYTPKQFFIDNPKEKTDRKDWTPPPPPKAAEPPRPMGTLNFDLVKRSNSAESNFVQFLGSLFNDNTKVSELCQKYYLGATKAKEVIYWQVDESCKVRSGKVMQYDPKTGKRQSAPDWIHSRMKKAGQLNDNYNLIQCFFGQHLLKLNPTATIAVVEAEKTAVICSGLKPDFIWIAAGQLQGLNIDKSSCLAGRKVLFFPDLSKDGQTFEVWKQKATEIMKKYGCKIIVSDLLERNATDAEREKGLDIADFLIRERKGTPPPPAPSEIVEVKPPLYEIAFDIVGERNHLTREIILNNMIRKYKTDCFDMMLQKNILFKTHINTYCMAHSTPY